MVLVVDDKSKDAILDQLMANIHQAQVSYCTNIDDPEVRAKYKEKLMKLTMVYNQLIDKKISKLNGSMIRNLHVPGPQSPEEKAELLALIDSV